MGRKSQSKAGAGPRVTFIRLQNWRGLGFAWLESQMPRSRHGHIVLGFAGKLKATWKKFSRLSANAGPCGDKGGSVYRHGEKVAFPTGCFLQARPRRSPAVLARREVDTERPRRRPAAARRKTGRSSQDIAACAGENHRAVGAWLDGIHMGISSVPRRKGRPEKRRTGSAKRSWRRCTGARRRRPQRRLPGVQAAAPLRQGRERGETRQCHAGAAGTLGDGTAQQDPAP